MILKFNGKGEGGGEGARMNIYGLERQHSESHGQTLLSGRFRYCSISHKTRIFFFRGP